MKHSGRGNSYPETANIQKTAYSSHFSSSLENRLCLYNVCNNPVHFRLFNKQRYSNVTEEIKVTVQESEEVWRFVEMGLCAADAGGDGCVMRRISIFCFLTGVKVRL